VNSSFHEYCAVCGTKLLVVCPICYLPNSVEAVICERCGVNIQEELQRRETWMDLKKMHDRKRKDALVQALEDEQRIELQRLLAELDEPERHAFAIFYLCQHGEAALEPLLETLRIDPDPDARYGAARALGMLGDDRAIPTLIEALSDPEPAVRYWAVDTLVTLEATSSSEAIRGLSRDPFKWVQERAKKALRELE
jgi:HEAT repeat protein